MQKWVVLFLFILAPSTLFAAGTTLKLPLLNNSDRKEPLSSYNSKLKTAGLPVFPDYIELTTDKDSTKFEKYSDMVDKANAKLSLKLEVLTGSIPEDFQSADGKQVPCYTGDPLKVAELVKSFTDSVFSDQLTVIAFKYKSTTTFVDVDKDTDLSEAPKEWKAWKGKTETVSVLTSIGDDGTDIEDNLIVKCE